MQGDALPLLRRYLGPLRRQVAVLGVVLLGTITLQLAHPQVIRWLIDAARVGVTPDDLARAALVYVALVLLGQLGAAGTAYLAEDVGWSATNALRLDLVRHILTLDLSFHAHHTPGALVERVDGDVGTLANFFSQLVLHVAGNLLLLLGIVIVVAAEDARLGIVLALYAALALAVLGRLQGIAVPFHRRHREALAALSGCWEERIAGTEDLRGAGAVPHTLRLHAALLRRQVSTGRAAGVMGRVYLGVWEILWGLGSASAFVTGAYLLGAGALSLGTLYLVFHYTGMLAVNLLRVTQQLSELQAATAAIQRVAALQRTSSALSRGGTSVLPPGPLALELHDVTFAYPAARAVEPAPTLRSVSFRLEAGHVLGVLGRTGSGKSTLARLLFRFYDPVQGAIRLAGTDLRAVPLDCLRRRVGLVPQEVQILRGTVRDSITLFDPAVSDAQIETALASLGLCDWLERLPARLESEIGAGTLSAGEAQLVALSRVCLQDPGLIVLDEPAARIDLATAQLVERALDRLLAGRTTVLIAHRLETVQRADQILVLDQGRVAEYGDRAALAADPTSRYSQLLRAATQRASSAVQPRCV